MVWVSLTGGKSSVTSWTQITSSVGRDSRKTLTPTGNPTRKHNGYSSSFSSSSNSSSYFFKSFLLPFLFLLHFLSFFSFFCRSRLPNNGLIASPPPPPPSVCLFAYLSVYLSVCLSMSVFNGYEMKGRSKFVAIYFFQC